MRALKLYLQMISVVVKSQMQYRVTFVIVSVSYLAMPIMDFAMIFLYFSHFNSLGSWSNWETAMIYAVTSTAFGVTECAMRGFDIFPTLIRSGDYDRILLRPVNAIAQIMARDFPLMRLGRAAVGIVFLCVAWRKLHLPIEHTRILVIVFAIVGSTAIFLGVNLIMGAISFITTKRPPVVALFADGTREMARYPVSAYPKWFARFYVYALPVACTTYFPVLFVLDKSDDLFRTGHVTQSLAPLAGIVFALLSFRIWVAGSRRYSSTGS